MLDLSCSHHLLILFFLPLIFRCCSNAFNHLHWLYKNVCSMLLVPTQNTHLLPTQFHHDNAVCWIDEVNGSLLPGVPWSIWLLCWVLNRSGIFMALFSLLIGKHLEYSPFLLKNRRRILFLAPVAKCYIPFSGFWLPWLPVALSFFRNTRLLPFSFFLFSFEAVVCLVYQYLL